MAASANPGGGGGTKVDPSVRSSSSAQMLVRTQMIRAVYGGTETMRDQGEAFLPRYEKESKPRYDARLASTFALNKTREAVDAASAKPFRTLVTVTNGDPDLDLWLKDIDLTGNHLHIFGHAHFNDSMLVGQGHILVDHPTTMNLPNLAAQQASGVRPFMKRIRDDNLLAAYTERVGGDNQVLHARIADTRVQRNPDFTESIINQVYVLEVEPGAVAGIVQLWEKPASGGDWVLVGESPLTMNEVPLVSMFAGDTEGAYVTRPIFLDLAFKQIEHWISSSDQRSILSAARFPMLAASGVEIDPEDESGFAIGPFKVLYSPDPFRALVLRRAGRPRDRERLQGLVHAGDADGHDGAEPGHGHPPPIRAAERARHPGDAHPQRHPRRRHRLPGFAAEGDPVHGPVGGQGLLERRRQHERRLHQHGRQGQAGRPAAPGLREEGHLARDLPHGGAQPRLPVGRLRSVAEMARMAAIDAAELAAMNPTEPGQDPVKETTTVEDFPDGQTRPKKQI